MGVPAFYRWISEKYGKIVVDMLEKRPNVVNGVIIPIDLREKNPNDIEYDNLYVDMNGLIHPCSHPEDREPPKTETEMYENVTKYVDRLVSAVRPRRLLYLAVDGVAPRAKMNQQRSRRFRAAQDALDKKKMMDEVMAEVSEMGYDLPETTEAWDSNVITPGTEFMANLSDFLHHYILYKMNTDAYWKTIKVVFSDASEPGEGEHKIMGYIRHQRTQTNYDPNQRHILHGLDADLIMLALATHEAHFTILREKVFFGRKGAKDENEISDAQKMLNQQSMLNGVLISSINPEEEWVFSKPLQALHCSVLRDYLDNEFSCLKGNLSFKYDLERIIDDFIFICFFVGNDFLPHLPSLDIRDGALDFLIECYKEILPFTGEYLTSPGGDLNLRATDIILGKVGEIEDLIFMKKKQAEDNNERRFEEQKLIKQNRLKMEEEQRASVLGKRDMGEIDLEDEEFDAKIPKLNETSTPKKAENNEPTEKIGKVADIKEMKEILNKRIKEKESSIIDKYKETIQDPIRLYESGWKDRYYNEKYKKENIESGGGLKRMCYTYVQGLCWVLKYYFQGCPSWNWYYPFHYAPFASDLVNIDSYGEIKFELSQPFRPVEQLLAVLPANSVHALPAGCQWLMTEEKSPIADLYESDIPIDPNGKHLPWLWVLLLPFIDETRVTAAFESCKKDLTLEERLRNAFGPSNVYFFENNEVVKSVLEGEDKLKYGPGVESDVEVLNALKDQSSAVEESLGVEGEGENVSDMVVVESVNEKTFFDCTVGKGMSGFISKPSPRKFINIHTLVKPKPCFSKFFRDIEFNRVFCFTYDLPETTLHLSALLPGVTLDPTVLTHYDLLPRRPPRLNRMGFNVLDLFRQQQQRSHQQTIHSGNSGNHRNLQGSFFQAPPPHQQQQNYNQNYNGNGNYPPRSRYDNNDQRQRYNNQSFSHDGQFRQQSNSHRNSQNFPPPVPPQLFVPPPQQGHSFRGNSNPTHGGRDRRNDQFNNNNSYRDHHRSGGGKDYQQQQPRHFQQDRNYPPQTGPPRDYNRQSNIMNRPVRPPSFNQQKPTGNRGVGRQTVFLEDPPRAPQFHAPPRGGYGNRGNRDFPNHQPPSMYPPGQSFQHGLGGQRGGNQQGQPRQATSMQSIRDQLLQTVNNRKR